MAERTIPAPRRTTVPLPQGKFSVSLALASRAVVLADELVMINTAGGNVEMSLPPASGQPIGRTVTFADAGGIGKAFVVPDGTDEVLGGGAGIKLDITSGNILVVTLTCDGTSQWNAVGMVQPDAVPGQVASLAASMRLYLLAALGVEAASVRATSLQTLTGLNVTIGGIYRLLLEVFDDALYAVPSVNGTATVGTEGTVVAGGGSNAVTMNTNGSGYVDIDVTDLVGGATHWIRASLVFDGPGNEDKLLQGHTFVTGAWA